MNWLALVDDFRTLLFLEPEMKKCGSVSEMPLRPNQRLEPRSTHLRQRNKSPHEQNPFVCVSALTKYRVYLGQPRMGYSPQRDHWGLDQHCYYLRPVRIERY